MRHIGIHTRGHTLDNLIHILFEVALVVRGYTRVFAGHFVFDEVLSENEVIDGIAGDELHVVLEKLGIIFRLVADFDIDFTLVFLTQSAEHENVIVLLFLLHAEARVIAVAEHVRRMVGEAECRKAGIYGALYIFPLTARGVVAAECMGMKALSKLL